jgi:formylglycine-generating enzyme required for sulfatase activity
MRRWFLSYNSQDSALMQGLEATLKRSDIEAKVFVAPTGLRAGGFWLPELSKEIAEATAFVLLVGERGLGPWQVIEYYEALDRRVKQHDFPVILVLLDGQPAPGLPFLRQLHWIISADPASEQSVGQIVDAAAGGGSPPGALWRHTAPYRGLAAMEEKDSDYFFGRGRETVDVIRALEATPNKLPVLLGNSGVGKSSLAQAGVLAAFVRQAWPETADAPGSWPQAFSESRHWCMLTLKPGTEPVRALVEPFLRTWQFDAVDPVRARLQASWASNLLAGAVSLRDLLDATKLRYRDDLHQPEPPAFLLYIDQGEELYVRAEGRQRERFSQILAEGLADPRLRALLSLRADFFGDLQKDEALYAVHRQINVTPLREAQLREVVSKPAALLGARFENQHLAADIARRAAEDSSRDAGALPLLSYLLDDMWKSKDAQWDGVLRLSAPAIELGRVLVDRANAFIATHPGSEDALRRIFTLKLATVREDGEPTRRGAFRSEFSDEEWRLVSDLADHPNRLLATVTAESGEIYAEVAHEAIFHRWDKLHEWIDGEREFLIWRTGLERDRSRWQATPDASKQDALLMGAALAQAQSWLAKRAEDLLAPDRQFIGLSIEQENKAQWRARRVRSLVYALLVGMILGLVGWIEQSPIKAQWLWWTSQRPFVSANIWPYPLDEVAEQALKPGESFRECAPRQQDADYCPDMVVVPAGTFLMGSPASDNDLPLHQVNIAKPFAVSKFELTIAEWDACVAGGGCSGYKPSDSGWGRGRQPAININWDDAEQYVAWLSQMTGKRYRLLAEAEYEYAARANMRTEYPWGNEIGKNKANCEGCGNQWDGKTAPVGSFDPNDFGLYDMVGNVWEFVEDCYHPSYEIETPQGKADAPTDGSAWTTGNDCSRRVVRGGSWYDHADALRSASRRGGTTEVRNDSLGFRVARTITP